LFCFRYSVESREARSFVGGVVCCQKAPLQVQTTAVQNPPLCPVTCPSERVKVKGDGNSIDEKKAVVVVVDSMAIIYNSTPHEDKLTIDYRQFQQKKEKKKREKQK